MKRGIPLLFAFLILLSSVCADEIIVSEPLTSAPSSATVNGGQFSSSGWKTLGDSNYILFNLQQLGVTRLALASVEFDVNGLSKNPSQYTKEANKHVLYYMWDGSWSCPRGSWCDDSYNPYKGQVIIYGCTMGSASQCDTQTEKWKTLKFRVNVNADMNLGRDSVEGAYCFESYTERKWDWDPSHTYHIKIEWGEGHIKLYVDGEMVKDYDYSGLGEEYVLEMPMIMLGHKYAKYWGVPVGVTYSNLVIKKRSPGGGANPQVEYTEPANNEQDVATDSQILIMFDRKMDEASVESALTITPSIGKQLSWSGKSLIIKPTNTLSMNTQYTVRIDGNAEDFYGTSMAQAYQFSFRTGDDQQPSQIGRYEVFEVMLKSSSSHSNPYTNVQVTGTFTSPSGRQLSVNGFWDGENVWRLRFSPDETGSWSYSVTSTDNSLQKSGSFSVTNSQRKGYFKQSGSYPYTFEYANGDPMFWVGDTSWSLMSNVVPFSTGSFQTYIDRISSLGFNNIHFNLGRDSTSPNDGKYQNPVNEGGSMFSGSQDQPDYSRINPEFFKWVDKKVKYMNDRGIAAGFFFTWADWFVKFSLNDFKRYVSYVVSRYSAYNVYWVISGEYTETGSISDYNSVGSMVKQQDPYPHVMSIHPSGGESSASHLGLFSSWMSYIMQQKGKPVPTCSLHNEVMKDRTSGRPVVNAEYGYEREDGRYGKEASGDDIRKASWCMVTAGGYFTYGNEATYKSKWSLPPEPSDGQIYISHLSNLMNSIPFEQMEPSDGIVSNGHCLAKSGSYYLVYLESGSSTTVTLSPKTYYVYWINPRNGEIVQQTTITARGAESFSKPISDDALLYISTSQLQYTPATTTVSYNANVDGVPGVNLNDLIMVAINLGDPNYHPATDVDGNGKVDMLDLIIVAWSMD